MAGRKENLKPKTSPQARGKLGGIKSGQVRKEKKMMSQIMADFLAKDHDISGVGGKKEKITSSELLFKVMTKVLSRGDSASVQLIKTITEATEGTKQTVDFHLTTEEAKEIHALFAVEIKSFGKENND